MRYRNQIAVSFNAAGEVGAAGADYRRHVALKLTTAFGEADNDATRDRAMADRVDSPEAPRT